MAAAQAIKSADRLLAQGVRQILTGGAMAETGSASPAARPFANLTEWEDPEIVAILPLRAEFHGVGLLLASAPHVLADWPRAVAEKITELGRCAALEEPLHRAELASLIDRLAQKSIPCMVLKGSALAYLYYANPAMRPRGDSDLLIRARDLAAARDCLRQAGWTRIAGPFGLRLQEAWHKACGAGITLTLDLHWHPSDRPVLQNILIEEEFWDHRVGIPRLSNHASAPDPLRLLLHGAINQVWHATRGFQVEHERVLGGRRLIWAVDYHHITASFSQDDWEALIGLCQQRDAGAIIFAALDGARADIGLAIPDGVLERLLPQSGQSAVWDYINNLDAMGELAADLKAAGSLPMRWQLGWHLAFAPRDHLIRKYPSAAHWPTALLQLRRYGSAAARLLGLRQPSHGPHHRLNAPWEQERKP